MGQSQVYGYGLISLRFRPEDRVKDSRKPECIVSAYLVPIQRLLAIPVDALRQQAGGR